MKTELIAVKEVVRNQKKEGLYETRQGTAVVLVATSGLKAMVVHYGCHYELEMNCGDMVSAASNFEQYWKRLPAGSQVLLTQE